MFDNKLMGARLGGHGWTPIMLKTGSNLDADAHAFIPPGGITACNPGKEGFPMKKVGRFLMFASLIFFLSAFFSHCGGGGGGGGGDGGGVALSSNWDAMVFDLDNWE